MEKLTSSVSRISFLNRRLLPLCLCHSSRSESDHCWINRLIRAALCSPSHSSPIGAISGCGWGMSDCVCALNVVNFLLMSGFWAVCTHVWRVEWLCDLEPEICPVQIHQAQRITYESATGGRAPAYIISPWQTELQTDWGVKSQTKAEGVFRSFQMAPNLRKILNSKKKTKKKNSHSAQSSSWHCAGWGQLFVCLGFGFFLFFHYFKQLMLFHRWCYQPKKGGKCFVSPLTVFNQLVCFHCVPKFEPQSLYQ